METFRPVEITLILINPAADEFANDGFFRDKAVILDGIDLLEHSVHPISALPGVMTQGVVLIFLRPAGKAFAQFCLVNWQFVGHGAVDDGIGCVEVGDDVAQFT